MRSGKTRAMKRLIAMSVCAMMLFAGAATAQSVRYVDDDSPPGGDGLSWATAYDVLEDVGSRAAPHLERLREVVDNEAAEFENLVHELDLPAIVADPTP